MAKRQYNADTNKWEEKAPKTKPTPASNTRKKMKKKAEAEKKKPADKAPAPAKRKKPAAKAPVPMPRGSRPTKGESGNPANKGSPPKSPVGKFPSKSEMESTTGVKMKKKRFLQGTMMTGSMRKG